MYYIKNTSEQVLIEPETNTAVEPGACKQFKDDMAFLRFTAVFNGLCEIITEREYQRWLASFGELGGSYGHLGPESRIAKKEAENQEKLQEEPQEEPQEKPQEEPQEELQEEIQEIQEKSKKGRPKKK